MSSFNVVAETNQNTVVTEYKSVPRSKETYETEAMLEKEFIRLLCEQGYEYLSLHSQDELIQNLRQNLEELNAYKFTDNEWRQFFSTCIANPNEHIVEKTKKIQEINLQNLKCDNGITKNICLIDKENIHNNHLQVINQYVLGKNEGAAYDNRYDVTILVNGIPLVHIELKRRGNQIRKAFGQIERYQKDSFWAGCGLYEYIQIFVISNGTNTKYYSNSTRFNVTKNFSAPSSAKKTKTSNSFEFTSFWADANNKIIPDLIDFTKTFFAKHSILNILTKYCIFTSENLLMVMRPYQIIATERILNKIVTANNYKQYGSVAGGGYIWHTTGSGKTLTSFKTARLATKLPFIDKVLFVVDRKDLDYQTMKEYDRFEKGAADNNKSTAVLKKQLENSNRKIIITTIQKLASFIKKNANHEIYKSHVVIIFDECHRSQFGDMHNLIIKNFKKYHLFGFTGTPIFTNNADDQKKSIVYTTEQVFGENLHKYTIVNAIQDNNVLPFHVDYLTTMSIDNNIDDELVSSINKESAMMAPKRIEIVTKYILNNFDMKTYRYEKSYSFSKIMNIPEVASSKNNEVIEKKVSTRFQGFNSIFAVSSVQMAKLYYQEFVKQMQANPAKKIKIATIFSYSENEEDEDSINEMQNGLLGEENSEDTSALDQSSRDFLESAIQDYNKTFQTNYDTSNEKFQNYYRDVSLRMKNKEIDLLIVVNMFLTGFDATTLNTLWVDKNLKMHGLIQAFSRTNRILTGQKRFGNIICFRNLQKRVDAALALFGDKNAGGIVLIKKFSDYFNGYLSEDGTKISGYKEIIENLQTKFPITEPEIIGEKNQKEFISLFGEFLRMRNLLSSFDEFQGNELITERDLQDYKGRYLDLKDEWKIIRESNPSVDISDDVIFETELISQSEINIDYILMLVEKYHDTHSEDKEVFIQIQKAIDSSVELRSKKTLIESFLAGINEIDDIVNVWHEYIIKQREIELNKLIAKQNLKPVETRKFLEISFREGEIKSFGIDIDKIMPPLSRIGGVRALKKQEIIDDLQNFFEKFIGLCSSSSFTTLDNSTSSFYTKYTEDDYEKVADNSLSYNQNNDK